MVTLTQNELERIGSDCWYTKLGRNSELFNFLGYLRNLQKRKIRSEADKIIAKMTNWQNHQWRRATAKMSSDSMYDLDRLNRFANITR